MSSGRAKPFVYRQVFLRLPARRGSAVFESHLGRGFGDSPKYVYLALRAAGDTRRVVWSYQGDPAGYPTDATLVRRGSWRYWWELARAEQWVDNQGFPTRAPRRPTAAYLQTWHGSPYKVMGFDEPQLRAATPRRQQEFVDAVSRWTSFCVQSAFAEDVFATAFRHRAEVLRCGYPRNDPLLHPDVDADRVAVRRRLRLPDDRRLVLYAPTFRDWRRGEPAELPLDVTSVAADAPGWLLLVRSHYLQPVPVEGDRVRDVSDHPDMTELLLVADALITDYSSVMFDFALVRRPMLFFVPDLETYTRERGTYFDLDSVAPGPVVRRAEDVVAWLADPDAAHAAHAGRHAQFVDRFCTFERGDAADTVVRSFFGGGT
jgi:CDP-glycerol glycerophosphotransferase